MPGPGDSTESRKSKAESRNSRAGLALLLGRPNVGKSTLLNRLVGEHIAAVSPRPQTTRNRLVGVVNRPGFQLCLMDAPGVHEAGGTLLNRMLVRTAMAGIGACDLVLYIAEAGWPRETEPQQEGPAPDPVGPFHRALLAEVGRSGKPVVLVLNKIDLVPRPLLLPVIEAWSRAFAFREIYPLSALTGENVDRLVDVAGALLPEGQPLFPADQITDQSERALCAEYVREQVFLHTHDEVPYSTAVAIESFDESERPQDAPEAKGIGPGLVRIHATIVVEREPHKGIVIGKGGARLKAVGTGARREIERLLGCRIWLDLHVKVVPGWTGKRGALAEFGYLGR